MSSSISARARAAAPRELKRRYRRATVVALDIAPGMLREARRHFGAVPPLRARVRRRASACRSRMASVDIVVQQSDAAVVRRPRCRLRRSPPRAEARRLLRLHHLRPRHAERIARGLGSGGRRTRHVNTFIDMHDVGDALARAGLTEPVLDVERVTLTYSDVLAVMRDLKTIGAHNVTAGRAARPHRPRSLAAHARPPTNRCATRRPHPGYLRSGLRRGLGLGRQARIAGRSAAKCASRRARSGIASESPVKTRRFHHRHRHGGRQDARSHSAGPCARARRR